MRNVLSKVSRKHTKWTTFILKAMFAMENRGHALDTAESVAAEMDSKGLKATASCLREGIGESTTYLLDEYPVEHQRRIRTNNMIERLNREIRKKTRVVGSFPTAGARLCSYTRTSATSPPASGAHTVTWTCPGSTAPCNQRTEITSDDGSTTFAQDIGHNPNELMN